MNDIEFRKRAGALSRSYARVFAIPALVALVSTIGLVSALVGDGFFDTVSWIALGIPVVLIPWAIVAAPSA